MRKSANMITDDVVKMVTGIENIEVFLEENDEWQLLLQGKRHIWLHPFRRVGFSVLVGFHVVFSLSQ